MLSHIALRAKQNPLQVFRKYFKPYLYTRFGLQQLYSTDINESTLHASLSLSSGNEKIKKSVKCSICGEHGHNKRTCPKSHLKAPQTGLSENLSDSAVNKLADEYYSGWITKYRLLINQISREFMEEDSFRDEADRRMIDMETWQAFVGKFRRGFILDPFSYTSNKREFLQFAKYLDDILQLKRAFTTTAVMENSEENYNQKVKFFKNKIFDLLLARAQLELKDVIHAESILRTATDLRNPAEWYPFTRLLKRKIIFHGGPTNSGKTYHALKRLAEADPAQGGGLYCGPLRLLALEVYENLNKKGIYTNLMTGQEKREVPGATHTSCTLEMVSLHKHYDVVVIDEIQMIADRERGYAWTWALLGLIANEVHLCGGMEAAQIVQNLVESTGDEFILQPYKRLAPLYVADESLGGDYSKVRPGDCIVAFSRGDIFSIRRTIESLTPYKCAIIYGQLPPETRSTQARLFNEENTGFDILVASDAIGMGLNLNIRRIVFHTAVKGAFNNSDGPWVEATSIKQIAGRAGRLSSNYKFGEVTAWQEIDLAYIRAVMDAGDLPPIDAAGVFPTVGQIEAFTEYYKKSLTLKEDNSKQMINQTFNAKQVIEIEEDDNDDGDEEENEEFDLIGKSAESSDEIAAVPANEIASILVNKKENLDGEQTYATAELNNMQLSSVLDLFKKFSKIDGRYFLCDYSGAKLVSNWLHSIPLTITDKFIFSTAPVNSVDTFSMSRLYEFASAYALGRPVGVSNISFHRRKPRNVDEFAELCYKHNAIELYLWLSFRFPKLFIEREQCLLLKTYALNLIEQTLSSSQLMHMVSHSKRYNKMRQRYPPDTLPSANPVVRELAERYLSEIPVEKLYIIPKEDSYDDSDYRRRRESPSLKAVRELSHKHRRVWEIDDDATDAKHTLHVVTEESDSVKDRTVNSNDRSKMDRASEESSGFQERRKRSNPMIDSVEGSDSAPERRNRSIDSRENKYRDRDRGRNGEQTNRARAKDAQYSKGSSSSRDRNRDREGSDRVQDKRKQTSDRRDNRARDGSDPGRDRRRQSSGPKDRNREGDDSDVVREIRRDSRVRGRKESNGRGDRQGKRYPTSERKGDVDRKMDRRAEDKKDSRADRRGRRDEPRQRDRGPRETRREPVDVSQIRCRLCKELGHIAIHCPTKTRVISESSQRTSDIHMPVQEQIATVSD